MIDKNNNYTTTVDYWSSFSRMLFAKKFTLSYFKCDIIY